MPPLRERPSDIPLLIQHFLGQAKREFNKKNLAGASRQAVQSLKAYSWPGNVRQLRAVIRRCVIDSVLPVIVPEILPAEIRSGSQSSPSPLGETPTAPASSIHSSSTPAEAPRALDDDRATGENPRKPIIDGSQLPELIDRLLNQESNDLYAQAIAYAERYLLLRVLRFTDGNQSKAAEILGITRGKLRDRIATYQIKLESGVKIGE